MTARLNGKMAIAAGVMILMAVVTLTIAICRPRQNLSGFESPVSAFNELAQTSNGGLLLGAVNFLVSRKTAGRLPGVAANAHVGIDFPWLYRGSNDGAWHFTATNFGSYPIALTLTVRANGIHSRYCYTIAKNSSTNDWQLEKAWLSDTNGRVVQKFAVY